MNIEDFREYCLLKPETSESFPFDETTLVFKVAGKIFALTDINEPYFKVNLKCNPEKAVELRELYSEVQPGYHMNKKHWNTIDFEGALRDKLLKEMIDESYWLVVDSLKKEDKLRLKNQK
jgi:predicted DNA-binding protein (MmcQ/YjbR family)